MKLCPLFADIVILKALYSVGRNTDYLRGTFSFFIILITKVYQNFRFHIGESQWAGL